MNEDAVYDISMVITAVPHGIEKRRKCIRVCLRVCGTKQRKKKQLHFHLFYSSERSLTCIP